MVSRLQFEGMLLAGGAVAPDQACVRENPDQSIQTEDIQRVLQVPVARASLRLHDLQHLAHVPVARLQVGLEQPVQIARRMMHQGQMETEKRQAQEAAVLARIFCPNRQQRA